MPKNGTVFSDVEGLYSADPNRLIEDEERLSKEKETNENLKQSVKNTGIIQPPIVRYKDDKLYVIDGMRRVKAAKEVGKNKITVLFVKATDIEVRIADFLANFASPFRKQVTSDDRDDSLRDLSKLKDRDVRDIKKELGILTDKQDLEEKLMIINGVGKKKAKNISKRVGDSESFKKLSIEELEEIPGIGSQLARDIHNFDFFGTKVHFRDNLL